MIYQLIHNDPPIQNKKKRRCATAIFAFYVVLRGFEPRLREPKSPVLPLYYRTIPSINHASSVAVKKNREFVAPYILLPRNESNTRQKNQNLLYYHYTTGQSQAYLRASYLSIAMQSYNAFSLFPKYLTFFLKIF